MGKGKGKQSTGKGQKPRQERISRNETHETQTSQDHTERTNTSWNQDDTWDDADWWINEWRTDLWSDPTSEQVARQMVLPQPAQE